MKVALCSSFVPFVDGGLRSIVNWLAEHLIEHGHQVEIVWLPFVQNPETMFRQMSAYRMIDMTGSADKLIAFRPPSYVVVHPNKTLWFIHHFRAFYDLWDTKHRPGIADTEYGTALRRHLIAADTRAIGEAKRVYTNSKVVSARLKHYNGIDSEVLYPPLRQAERFRSAGYGEEIVCISRKEEHKRQHLLIEAMCHVKSGVKLRLCGVGSGNNTYPEDLRNAVDSHGLRGTVILDDSWISEDEKIELLSCALAIVYVPLDEDSYGYPILEGAHARRATITTSDSGGTLEFVEDGRNGFVCDPTPEALASRFDELYRDRQLAQKLGGAAYDRIGELKIDWTSVIEKMLE